MGQECCSSPSRISRKPSAGSTSTGKPPCQLDWDDLDTEMISAFLDQLETERHNSPRTRNLRLTAIRSLLTYASLRHPEHAAVIQQVLAIPPKRFDKPIVSFLTAVEIDPVVLSMRSQFLVPPDDDRLTVIQADGADHVAQMVDRGERIDAILVDAYDHTGIANAVVERSFVENTKQILGTNGVFVMNLVAESADAKRHVETVRQVFGDAVVVAMQRGGNLVIFAGQTLHDPQRAGMAVRNAERAEDRLGLFFPTLIQHLNDVAGKLPP